MFSWHLTQLSVLPASRPLFCASCVENSSTVRSGGVRKVADKLDSSVRVMFLTLKEADPVPGLGHAQDPDQVCSKESSQ